MARCEYYEKRLVCNSRSCAFQSIAIAEMVILLMRMILLDWHSRRSRTIADKINRATVSVEIQKPKMAYIPKDAKWYIAEIVMECRIEGNFRNVVHVNIVLVRADSPEEAFEKAEQLGRESENSYLNPKNQKIYWIYRGLRDLNVIHDELKHGAELMFEEKIDLNENEVQDMVTAKSQLNVFRPHEPRDSSQPNYSCKEIIEEALSTIKLANCKNQPPLNHPQ